MSAPLLRSSLLLSVLALALSCASANAQNRRVLDRLRETEADSPATFVVPSETLSLESFKLKEDSALRIAVPSQVPVLDGSRLPASLDPDVPATLPASRPAAVIKPARPAASLPPDREPVAADSNPAFPGPERDVALPVLEISPDVRRRLLIGTNSSGMTHFMDRVGASPALIEDIQKQIKRSRPPELHRTLPPEGVPFPDDLSQIGRQLPIKQPESFAPSRGLFYLGQFRPMLLVTNDFEHEITRFYLGSNVFDFKEPNATPKALANSLQSSWKDIQRLGQSVGKVVGLKSPGFASCVYLGSRRVFTSGHVAQLAILGTTRIEWPTARSSANFVSIIGSDLARDLAILLVDAEPDGVPSGENWLAASETPPPSGTQISIVGFPMSYGDLSRTLEEQLFGSFGNLRHSPGVIRPATPVPFRVFHDCATSDGSSGGPVLSLNPVKVIGLQTGTITQTSAKTELNVYTPVSQRLLSTNNVTVAALP